MLLLLFLLLLLCLALMGSPLTGVLGYESAQLVALLFPFLVPWVGSHGDRKSNPHDLPRLIFPLAILALLPAVLLALNALRIPNCAPWQGLAFYGLLAGGNLLIWSGLWLWLGSWGISRGIQRLLYFVAVLLTLGLNLLQPVLHPQLFAYSAFWGFFPGPIYDEVLIISDKVLWSRATGLAVALFFWAGALQRRSGSADARWWSLVAWVALGLALSSYALFPRFHLTGWTDQVRRELGGQIQTRHATLYYAKDLFQGPDGAGRLQAVCDDLDYTYESVAEWLNLTADERKPVTVYLHGNARLKKQLIGAGATQFAHVWRRELHIQHEEPPHSVLRHEMVHLLAADWAPPLGIPLLNFGLVEGLAEAGERQDVRFTPEVWSHYLEATGKRIPLADMLAPWDFWRAPANKAYGEWGAFLGWLFESRGAALFRRAYGGESFEQAYGAKLEELESEWLESLKAVEMTSFEQWAVEESSRRRSLFEKPCARELARLRDLRDGHLRQGEAPEALSVCHQIEQFEFNLVDDLWRWVQAAARAGDAAHFADLAGRMHAHPDLDAGMLRNLTVLEADMAWREGRLEEALEGYHRAVVADWNSGTQREIVLKIAAIENGDNEDREALHRYLESATPPVETEMFLLRMAQRGTPASWAFSYLLLKRLAGRGAWDEIQAWRQQAGWDLDYPEFRTNWEREKILARLSYETGQPLEAAERFARLAAESPWRGEGRALKDWAERSRWKAGQAAPK